MKDQREKLSYCLGFEAAMRLKQQFHEIDPSFMEAGFREALSGAPPRLPEEEIERLMQRLHQEVERQQRAFLLQIAEQTKREGEEFLAANKLKSDVLSLPSGLQYQVLQEGEGERPSMMDLVQIRVAASFIDGRPIEGGPPSDQPQLFPVNRVIPGWAEALQKMRVGGKWRLFVPSYLAYGEHGIPNAVPPNAALIFDLELLGIAS